MAPPDWCIAEPKRCCGKQIDYQEIDTSCSLWCVHTHTHTHTHTHAHIHIYIHAHTHIGGLARPQGRPKKKKISPKQQKQGVSQDTI